MTPDERLEFRDLILECLAVHETRKVKIRAKQSKQLRQDLDESIVIASPPVVNAVWAAWVDNIGVTPYGRLAKALKPLFAQYDAKWIAEGIRAFAAESHREGRIKYASPENFASRAAGYILPAMPSNELTEREAALIGMTESRDHAATLGLLTDRARG